MCASVSLIVSLFHSVSCSFSDSLTVSLFHSVSCSFSDSLTVPHSHSVSLSQCLPLTVFPSHFLLHCLPLTASLSQGFPLTVLNADHLPGVQLTAEGITRCCSDWPSPSVLSLPPVSALLSTPAGRWTNTTRPRRVGECCCALWEAGACCCVLDKLGRKLTCTHALSIYHGQLVHS